MRVAVVVTVLNEAKTIDALLTALASQTLVPDTVVLVDGGSKDRTLELARAYLDRLPGLQLLEAPGSNISQGRNRGIAATECPLIAVTDAGCRPDPDWLAQIVSPLQVDPTVEWVSGAVKPDPANHFEACVGLCSLTFRMQIAGLAFLPTARSLAFRRELWERLDGFPAELDFGEDLAFIFSAASAGAGLHVAPLATVRWRPRGSYREVVRQYFCYARGTARAGLIRRFHLRTVAQSIAGITFLAWGLASPGLLPWALLLILASLYLARKARQGCFATPGWRTIYRVPLILIAVHIGTMAGFATGTWQRIRTQ